MGYNQAANAASTALTMFENLAKYAEPERDGQHIPAVVAITSVGADTKVWLAYSDLSDINIRDHVCPESHPVFDP